MWMYLLQAICCVLIAGGQVAVEAPLVEHEHAGVVFAADGVVIRIHQVQHPAASDMRSGRTVSQSARQTSHTMPAQPDSLSQRFFKPRRILDELNTPETRCAITTTGM